MFAALDPLDCPSGSHDSDRAYLHTPELFMPQNGAISAAQMRLVLGVSRLLTVTDDLDSLLHRIAEAATSLIHAERASIFLHDPESDLLCTKVALGSREICVPARSGVVGAVFQSNELLEVSDVYGDPRFNRDIDRRTGFVTRNLLSAPVRDITGKPIGVLQVINRIGGAFMLADHHMIELLADQAGVAIQRHNFQQESIRSAELRHEMDLAHAVQRAMMPAEAPLVSGIDAVGWTRPASVTGGDAYDLWKTRDQRLGVFVADASGHGIAPAIVVSQVRTLIRSLSEINDDPTWLLERVNARLSEDLDNGRFVTAFFGQLASDGRLTWASAGHGPIFYRKGATGPFELLEPTAPPLGILGDLEGAAAQEVHLEPGGMLVVMSDGIFEAANADREIFDLNRVCALLETCEGMTPGQVLSMLRETLRDWQGNHEAKDDQTAVIIERSM